MDDSFPHLQRIRARRVGLNDVDIAAPNFCGNFGLDGILIAHETENGVVRVNRKLAEKFELHEGFLLVMSFVSRFDKNARQDHERLPKSRRRTL